ncbi:MAG: C10 family peptidase [Bacteroidaceae bacterium]|nr:C10 family peptidase [Bacteroidaceae bacterium]
MKIEKRTIVLMVSVLLSAGTWAQDMTEQEAAERALQFLRERGGASRAKVMGEAPSQPVLKAAKVEAEKIYAFNVEGGGYVIASGDSRTLPVLGYSDSGSIDWDNLPENMRAWLKQYDDAIATLGDRTDFVDGNLVTEEGEQQPVVRRAARAAIEPMIKTRWDQNPSPYYDMCPLYAGHNPEWKGQPCYAGCNAVALAQILNYWQWPKSLPDGLPGYEAKDYYGKNLTWHIDALPPVTFDWENMLDEYWVFNNSTQAWDLTGTEAQQQAVATLMRYCGQAIESGYSPVATSGYTSFVRYVLLNYFGYAASTYLVRDLFGIDEWEEMVYTELAEGRPVFYMGTSPTVSGHAFICDGYDGNGLFHINWGGQGNHDGYYSLSVLNGLASTNPNKGSEHLGFTQNQTMFIGLDPSLEELKNPIGDISELWQYKTMDILSENTVKFYFLFNNTAARTATIDFALGTIEADGTLNPRFIGDSNGCIIGISTNIMTFEIDSTTFQPGETFRLYPMLRFRDVPDAEWQIIPPNTIYIDAGRREDGKFFITNKTYPLEYVSAAITAGKSRLGGSSDVTVTIRNNGQTDYIGDIWLSAEGGRSINSAYIRAGQEGEVTFLFTPTHAGLVKFDLSTDYVGYFDSFTMEFDNDTIYSYDSYLVNNSYVTHEGNHYVYHVELCDRPSVTVPKGVPSDNIYFYARIASNDVRVSNNIRFEEEIRDYLRALPANAGNGDYKFATEVTLDIEQDGEYHAWSYLNEWLDAEHKDLIKCIDSIEYFTVTFDPTGVASMEDGGSMMEDVWYDLQGRKLEGKPSERGVYIYKGKKIVVNI